MDMTTRLKKALMDSSTTAKALAKHTGTSYSAVRHYTSGRRDMPATFIAATAAFLGVAVEDLVEGDEALLVVLGPANSIERKAALPLLGTLPDMTPHEAQAFRSTLARWIKADEVEFPERVERMRMLVDLLEQPLEKFRPDHFGPRELSDYRVAMLHALSLAMPKRA